MGVSSYILHLRDVPLCPVPHVSLPCPSYLNVVRSRTCWYFPKHHGSTLPSLILGTSNMSLVLSVRNAS